jgi:transcription antitermination factor NusG
MVTKGIEVTINFGPFAGLNGVVISVSPERTVVRVVLNGRSFPVEVDPDMLVVPVSESSGRVAELSRSRPA